MEDLKTGLHLTHEDEKKIKLKLFSLKRRLKTSICNRCGEEIKFYPDEKGKSLPHDMDDVPHWQTCAHSSFAQKKSSIDIMKKLAVLYIMKYGIDLEQEAGLTKREAKIVQAVLEKIFKEDDEEEVPALELDDTPVNSEIQFQPEPCDVVGDPDEERAPSEDCVQELEKEIDKEHKPDKAEVQKAIENMILENETPK